MKKNKEDDKNTGYKITINGKTNDANFALGDIARASDNNLSLNSLETSIRNTRIRSDFNRKDYEFIRPDSEIPDNSKQRILAAQECYDKIGIVHNVIDMMGDFVCKGIDLAHKTKTIENFYKEWWKKIKGQDRTERIANLLYRIGSVVLKRSYANMTLKDKDLYKKGKAPERELDTTPVKIKGKYRIPWDYTIMNPASLEVLSGDIAPLLGRDKIYYGVRLDKTLIDRINEANNKKGLEAYKVAIPENILSYSDEKKPNIYKLDPKDTIALFYKKDDWQIWATPMTFPILPDLQVYLKLRLSDLSALDGICNYLRIIRLGNIDAQIWPDDAAFEKISNILGTNSSGGPIDIVWGPDIDIVESNTDMHNFLNKEKYESTLNAIYGGLGIPAALTGASGGGSQTYNSSFITLKTLIERLQYVRNIITDFWQKELDLVAKEMDFPSAAKLVYEDATISDESVANKLLIELLDRQIISEEAVMERTNFYPDIEKARKNRESKMRDSGKLPMKTSQLNIPELQIKMKEIDAKNASKLQKGKPGEGRPVGEKDSVKRKQKKVKIRSKGIAKAFAWAKETQKKISEVLTPVYLKAVGKDNVRQITQEQFNDFEDLKFAVLSKFTPSEKVEYSSVIEKVKSSDTNQDLIKLRNSTIQDSENKTTDYIRDLEATICGLKNIDFFESVL